MEDDSIGIQLLETLKKSSQLIKLEVFPICNPRSMERKYNRRKRLYIVSAMEGKQRVPPCPRRRKRSREPGVANLDGQQARTSLDMISSSHDPDIQTKKLNKNNETPRRDVLFLNPEEVQFSSP
jgi:hypothetical protein